MFTHTKYCMLGRQMLTELHIEVIYRYQAACIIDAGYSSRFKQNFRFVLFSGKKDFVMILLLLLPLPNFHRHTMHTGVTKSYSVHPYANCKVRRSQRQFYEFRIGK